MSGVGVTPRRLGLGAGSALLVAALLVGVSLDVAWLTAVGVAGLLALSVATTAVGITVVSRRLNWLGKREDRLARQTWADIRETAEIGRASCRERV